MAEIIYPEFDVIFEGQDHTHRAKFVKDKPSIKALMYNAADTNFYIDYEYLKQCKMNNEPARIPIRVVAEQKEWDDEVKKFKEAWKKSKDLNDKSPIITPRGFDRGDQKP